MARSCGFWRIRIAAPATARTTPRRTAAAIHSHGFGLATSAPGATGRWISASGREARPGRSISAATSGASTDCTSSSRRVATTGGAPDSCPLSALFGVGRPWLGQAPSPPANPRPCRPWPQPRGRPRPPKANCPSQQPAGIEPAKPRPPTRLRRACRQARSALAAAGPQAAGSAPAWAAEAAAQRRPEQPRSVSARMGLATPPGKAIALVRLMARTPQPGWGAGRRGPERARAAGRPSATGRARGPAFRRRRGWGRRRRGRRSGRLSALFRPVSPLDLGDRCVKRLLFARDVAFRQRRTQAPELVEQRLSGAPIDRPARRRRARVGQIGDRSHEQRMIISHEASAQPLRVMPRGVP